MLRTPPQLVESAGRSAFLTGLTLVGIASFFAVPAAAMPHLPVPTESFLNYHAANLGELSQEVTLDPQVRSRLAKHYHITEAQMTTYIHNNLVLRRLQHPGSYRVACVRRDGSEYYLEEHLPAGTPIFASRATGQPILKLACGNPMATTLPATVVSNKPLAAPKLASTPVQLAAANLDTPPVLTAIDGTQADLITPDDNSTPPVVLVSPSIQTLGGSSGLSSLFPILAGAGAAVAIAGHGGSNSSNIVPNTPVPQAVPEASTVTTFGLLALATGLLLIVRRKARPENA